MRDILKKLEKRVEALRGGNNQRVIVRYADGSAEAMDILDALSLVCGGAAVIGADGEADGRLLELLKGVIAA